METSLTRPAIKQPWLSIVRGMWVLLAMYNLLPGLLGLPVYYRQLVAMEIFPTNGSWTPENFQAASANSGFDPQVIAWLVVIPALIQILSNVGIGLVIFWKQSHKWLGLLASFSMVSMGGTFTGDHHQFLQALPQFWQVLLQEVGTLLWLGYFLFLILFPNGRFVPGWMRWVAVLLTAWYVATVAYNRFAGEFPEFFLPIGFALLSVIIYGKYQQYRWLSTPQEKQQIRWFLFAIFVFVTQGILTNLVDFVYPVPAQPGLTELLIYLGRVYLSAAAGALIPISIGIAIFRYRLWDIEFVIRQTLYYTVLTGLLGLVYVCIVTLLQALLVGSNDRQSPLVLVLSTLVIATLFNPMRLRIQKTIDQRFFRSRYDTAKTMEAFSSTVRQETDPQQLSANLVCAVQQSLQPESVTLWIRPQTYHRPVRAEKEA
jgi:hypothetical protein